MSGCKYYSYDATKPSCYYYDQCLSCITNPLKFFNNFNYFTRSKKISSCPLYKWISLIKMFLTCTGDEMPSYLLYWGKILHSELICYNEMFKWYLCEERYACSESGYEPAPCVDIKGSFWAYKNITIHTIVTGHQTLNKTYKWILYSISAHRSLTFNLNLNTSATDRAGFLAYLRAKGTKAWWAIWDSEIESFFLLLLCCVKSSVLSKKNKHTMRISTDCIGFWASYQYWFLCVTI